MIKKILLGTLVILAIIGIWIFAGIPGSVFTALQGSEGNLSLIRLPPGFAIEEYASVPGARSLEYAQDILFVGSRDSYVHAVRDGEVIRILDGMQMPNGVAYHEGSLYVAEVSKVVRYDDVLDDLDDIGEGITIRQYPDDTHHGWKFIRIGPDERLYIPVGAPCNVCLKEEPFASITRIELDGSGYEIIAEGVRNTVGFDFDSQGVLWFTDNGRDWLGENIPPDELNKLSYTGEHFGFPFCHGTNISDPELGSGNCSEYTPPVIELGPHVAALGMRFYEGGMFPEKYQGKIFIAEHGSWNREVPIGYRIMVADPMQRTYEVFAEGWLQGDKAWGRPVDIEQMPDGSLLVSDDKAGKVYRIYHQG